MFTPQPSSHNTSTQLNTRSHTPHTLLPSPARSQKTHTLCSPFTITISQHISTRTPRHTHSGSHHHAHNTVPSCVIIYSTLLHSCFVRAYKEAVSARSFPIRSCHTLYCLSALLLVCVAVCLPVPPSPRLMLRNVGVDVLLMS